jgi:hypothetical protein
MQTNMKNTQYDEIIDFGKKYFSKEEFEFALQLLKAAEDFNLENKSHYAAFFYESKN